MSYSRNFGFRSFENVVRMARHRVPATPAGGFAIGSGIVVDPTDPGFLTRPGANATPTPLSGICVFEHIQYQGDDPWLTSPQDGTKQFAPNGAYAQIVRGVGTKVWFRNVGDKTLYDGRVQQNEQLLADAVVTAIEASNGLLTAFANGLAPAADGKWQIADAVANAWLAVEQVNPSTGVIECRFTF